MAIAGAVFTIAARQYLENNIRYDLKISAKVIADMFESDIEAGKDNALPGGSTNGGGSTENVGNTDKGSEQLLLDGVFKKGLEEQDISYAIIDENLAVISSNLYFTDQFTSIVLTLLKPKLWNTNEGNFKIKIDNVSNIGIFSRLNSISSGKSKNNVTNSWIIIYTPLDQLNNLFKATISILLVSMAITGSAAIAFGIFFARSIAKPVIKLKNRAEALSKRDFDMKTDIKTGDELEELGNTFDRMAMELKEYDSAQKIFLQNASHELKTPLMSIQGYAEGIKDGVFESNEHALDIIVSESKRLKKIVDELILLSKLENIDGCYKFEEVGINSLILNCVEKVSSIAINNNIDITCVLEDDVNLKADSDKLTEALINILGNNLRYSRGKISIKTVTNGKSLEIHIEDDGEGFAGREAENIFDRFYKGKKGDTGLGLAITKAIIDKHGGSIEACNADSGGAEFTIKLRII